MDENNTVKTKVVELPVIPKDVAYAIESLRWVFENSEELLLDIPTVRERFEYGGDRLYGAILSYHDKNKVDYLNAIIHGYTIETIETTEEKVREYYRRKRRSIRDDHADGVLHGIERTLDLLGIKIEGVNE